MSSGIKFMIDHRKDTDLVTVFRFVTWNTDATVKTANELIPYIKKRGELLFADEALKKDTKRIHFILLRIYG
jgi:hypothetical protein